MDTLSSATLTKPRRPRSGAGSWAEILRQAAAIVRSYDTGVTLRQLFYRLVSGGLLENTRANYDRLSSRTAKARWERQKFDGKHFPELIDPTRAVVRAAAHASAGDALAELASEYRRHRTEGQPYQIWLGVEKRALVEQLYAWFGDPLGLPIVALGGYVTRPLATQIIHAVQADDDCRDAVMLYAGDFDATGQDIVANIRARLGPYFEAIQHVALTREQVAEYALPAAPGKTTDSRSAAFLLEHGESVQIELDALPPDVLRALYQARIDAFWDDAAHQIARQAEEADRAVLQSIDLP